MVLILIYHSFYCCPENYIVSKFALYLTKYWKVLDITLFLVLEVGLGWGGTYTGVIRSSPPDPASGAGKHSSSSSSRQPEPAPENTSSSKTPTPPYPDAGV